MENEDLKKCCEVHKALEENKKTYRRNQLFATLQCILFAFGIGIAGRHYKEFLGQARIGVGALMLLSIVFFFMSMITTQFYTDLIIKAKIYCKDASSHWKQIIDTKEDMQGDDELSTSIKAMNAKRLKLHDTAVKKCNELGENSTKGMMHLAASTTRLFNSLSNRENNGEESRG